MKPISTEVHHLKYIYAYIYVILKVFALRMDQNYLFLGKFWEDVENFWQEEPADRWMKTVIRSKQESLGIKIKGNHLKEEVSGKRVM